MAIIATKIAAMLAKRAAKLGIKKVVQAAGKKGLQAGVKKAAQAGAKKAGQVGAKKAAQAGTKKAAKKGLGSKLLGGEESGGLLKNLIGRKGKLNISGEATEKVSTLGKFKKGGLLGMNLLDKISGPLTTAVTAGIAAKKFGKNTVTNQSQPRQATVHQSASTTVNAGTSTSMGGGGGGGGTPAPQVNTALKPPTNSQQIQATTGTGLLRRALKDINGGIEKEIARGLGSHQTQINRDIYGLYKMLSAE